MTKEEKHREMDCLLDWYRKAMHEVIDAAPDHWNMMELRAVGLHLFERNVCHDNSRALLKKMKRSSGWFSLPHVG